MAIFDFTDANLRGDPRWQSAGRFTSYAPPLVLVLFLLCCTEFGLGGAFMTASPNRNVGFQDLIQPIFIPTLSFFNTIPSLHLHVLARNNPPVQVMAISGPLALCYIASAIIFLPPCVGTFGSADSAANDSSYKSVECPAGTPEGLWAAMVALHFASGLGYAMHFVMACKVRKVVKKQALLNEGVVDLEEEARQAAEARRRWAQVRSVA